MFHVFEEEQEWESSPTKYYGANNKKYPKFGVSDLVFPADLENAD